MLILSSLMLISATVPILLQIILLSANDNPAGYSTPSTYTDYAEQGYGTTFDSIAALVPKSSSLSSSSPYFKKCNILKGCSFLCYGEVDEFSAEMEERQRTMCQGKSMVAILENVDFVDGIIPADYFSGVFVLESLTITTSYVRDLQGEVFKQPSLENLHTLVLDGVSLLILNKNTFVGLKALKILRLHNNVRAGFSGVRFLVPIASTLNEAVICMSNSAMWPEMWLEGTNMTALTKLDLSANIFKVVTEITFVTLVQVEYLILSKCSIDYINEGTFDPISSTLRHLDLTHNNLWSLDWHFLTKMNTEGFILELKGNEWECVCENNDMIIAAQMKIIDFVENPICSSPRPLRGKDVLEVQLDCEGGGNAGTTTPKLTTTIQLPPSSTESTSTEKTTTESTSTEESTTTKNTPKPETTTTTSPALTTSNEYISTTAYTTASLTLTATYSTASPTLTTTKYPQSTVPITCTKASESFQWHVWRSDAAFHISSLSPTSVRILVRHGMADGNVLYFLTPHSNFIVNLTSNICRQMQTYVECIIEGLVNNQSYVFCMTKSGEDEISPFNCRSHFLEPFEATRNAWIRRAEVGLFVGITASISIVCMVFGCGLTYGTLRWRPTLLKGSSRFVRASADSKIMLLYPRNADSLSDQPSEVRQSTKNPASSIAASYVEPFNSRQPASFSGVGVPLAQAPEVPLENILHWERSLLTASTNSTEDLTQSNGQDMHEYECVEQYLELL